VGDELEEQVSLSAVDGKIAHIVDHHQGRAQIGLVVGLTLFKLFYQGALDCATSLIITRFLIKIGWHISRLLDSNAG
jgi:hypothetical protein